MSMKNIFGSRSLVLTKEAITKYPFYIISTTLYWLWTGLVFQGPAFYSSAARGLPSDIPSWWMPMLLYALSFLLIGFFFKRADKIVRTNKWLVFIAAIMTLGVLICIVWVYVPIEPPALGIAFYCLGTFLISFGAACFLSAVSRINGYLGPHWTLAVHIVGMICATILMAVFALLPQYVCHLFLLIAPSLFLICVINLFKVFPKKRLFDQGSATTLVKPKKLLATAALHGLPFGLALTMLAQSPETHSSLLFNAICFALGATCLFVIISLNRLDFNQIIYLLGFPLMGAGLLLVIVMPDNLILGCGFLVVGYAFLHIVMCGVNAYLGKQFNIPMPWILAWTTCSFMLGQASGALVGSLAANSDVPLYAVAAGILFMILVMSILMIDNRNMKYGWGIIKPYAVVPVLDIINLSCQFLSTENNLSDRETEILSFLAAGKSRKSISKELFITEETVKSHIHAIYKKLNVHSKEELMGIIQKQAIELEEK